MAIPGWTRTESPFHEGELAVQTRMGVRERMDRQGRRIVQEFFPEQHGFQVQVKQTFGNCPQYIQARMFELKESDLEPTPKPVREIAVFSEPERAAIAEADTFFIATAYQAKSAGMASGVDVSHRGGKPGFVRVDDERTLTIPDFSGNFQIRSREEGIGKRQEGGKRE